MWRQPSKKRYPEPFVSTLKSLFAILITAPLFAAPPAVPAKVFPYNYVQEDLPNGLRLVTVPTEFPRIVAVYIVVQAGSRNETEPGLSGFAHLFEHVMFKGTEKYPQARYEAVLKQIGASSNAYTTADYTCYHATFSKEDLETVLAMEADRFQNLKYSQAEFQTETLAVLGEYNKNSASPGSKLGETIASTAFTHHSYRHTTMGFLKDIQDMPNQYDYSLRFFDHYYRPEYTTVLVVGDVKPRAVREMVDKYWGQWKRGSFKAEIPAEPVQDAPRAAQVEWPSATLPLLSIAYKAPAYSDTEKDSAALEALAFLAFSPTSELYQRLVIREQKVDQLSANNVARVDPYLFDIRARIKNAADVEYVRAQILETVKAIRENPVDAARLDGVRSHLRYETLQRMDASDAIADILAPFVALRRTPETMNRFYDQLARLTPEDIRQAASKYLVENNRTMVTLTGSGSSK